MLNNPLKRTVSNKSFHRRSTRHRRKTRYSSQSDHGAEDVKPTIVHQLSRQLSKKFTNISLSTIRTADVIRVVEMGSHSELYYQLVRCHYTIFTIIIIYCSQQGCSTSSKGLSAISHFIVVQLVIVGYSSQSDHGAEDVKPTIVHQLSRQLSKKFTNISLTSDQDGEVSLTCKTQRCISRGYSKHDITIDEEVPYDRMEDLVRCLLNLVLRFIFSCQ